MKNIIIATFLLLSLETTWANTLITCSLSSESNTFFLEIDNNRLTGILTELNHSPINIESTDGKTFTGIDFLGSITLGNNLTSSVFTDKDGKESPLTCINNTFDNCRVPVIDYGNPHRNRDAKMRSCRAKAISLNLDNENQRACIATCMKN